MAWNTETILIIFVAFTGAAVFLQACVLIAIYISLKKAAKSALEATEDFKSTVLPMIMQRVDRQTQRLDSLLTSGLNALDRTAVAIESAVAAPVRQVNGIFAAVKAVVETYRAETPRPK